MRTMAEASEVQGADQRLNGASHRWRRLESLILPVETPGMQFHSIAFSQFRKQNNRLAVSAPETDASNESADHGRFF